MSGRKVLLLVSLALGSALSLSAFILCVAGTQSEYPQKNRKLNGRNAKTTNDHPGKPCPIQKKNCTTCHMPRVVLPSMHSPFVDHWIRIAKPKVPYPD
jgi:hypothetical protein